VESDVDHAALLEGKGVRSRFSVNGEAECKPGPRAAVAADARKKFDFVDGGDLWDRLKDLFFLFLSPVG
jgi:hypothetical protein